jgi:hypothetical protein
MSIECAEYLWAAVIGLTVGLIELVGRYRDNPWRALQTPWAAAYMAINAAAALLALYFLEVWRPEWVYGAPGTEIDDKIRLTAILVAGLGASTLLRSSFLKLKSPDGEIPIGPSVILDTLLKAVDRAVDRTMARDRAQLAAEIMGEISFDRAKAGLPAYCFALMQNVPIEEQLRLFSEVAKNATADIDGRIKSFNLGLGLLTIVGSEVLRRAVNDIRDQIKVDPPLSGQVTSRVGQLLSGVDYERARSALPAYCASIRGIPPEAAKKIAEQIALIDAAPVEGPVRSLMFGMALTQVFGFDVLELAVRDLGAGLHPLAPNERPDARVSRLMQGVDYRRARTVLPAFCLFLSPLPEEKQRRLADEVTAIDTSALTDDVKNVMLGMSLVRAVGVAILELAVASLDGAIRTPTAAAPQPLQNPTPTTP